MLSIGVLGINFKTADLSLREQIANGAAALSGQRAIFFHHPVVVLSTCNRTEIYFSGSDLAGVHSDLLAFLRAQIGSSFEQRLYSYFGIDCFIHLTRVAAGLDSAILAETEIQSQVRLAYGAATHLPSCLHYAFQKALKVSKLIRSQWETAQPSLYTELWQFTEWRQKRILLVGYSKINRGFISFLQHKGISDFFLCTKFPENVRCEGISIVSRSALHNWQQYEIIVCATEAEEYLVTGIGTAHHTLFDLSVPRTIDPEVGNSAKLYNIDQFTAQEIRPLHRYEKFIREEALKLARIYNLKTQRVPEIVEMGSHL